jgi:hypothetical protein
MLVSRREIAGCVRRESADGRRYLSGLFTLGAEPADATKLSAVTSVLRRESRLVVRLSPTNALSTDPQS